MTLGVGYPCFQSKENCEGVEGFIMKAITVPPHESSPGKQISSDSKVMSCGEGPEHMFSHFTHSQSRDRLWHNSKSLLP